MTGSRDRATGDIAPPTGPRGAVVLTSDAPQDDWLSPNLRRALALTHAGLWAERLAVAFWPAASWALGGVSAVALGGLSPLTGTEVLAVTGLWGAGLAGLGLWGALRFRSPKGAEAVARVDARLPGRPLSVLADRMAIGDGDAGAAALWAAHRAQARDHSQAAKAVGPDPQMTRRDPFGFRLVALTAGVMALIFGGAGPVGEGWAALASNFRPAPGLTPEAKATGPGWEGWAEPPAYTRSPTIYLNALADGAPLSLPKGSRVSLRLYGKGIGVLQDIGPAQADAATDAPAFTAEKSGVIRIGDRQFSITVAPDAPPTATLSQAAARRADGRFIQGFSASDDHGLAGGEAVIALDLAAVDRRYGLSVAPEPRDPVKLSIPVPGGAARVRLDSRIGADLAASALANLPVTVTLTVRDGIGQMGQAPVLHMTLPGRRFFNATAAAVIETRRDLLWNRDNAARVAKNLRMIIWDAEGAEPSLSDAPRATIRDVIATLEGGTPDASTRDAVVAKLWDVAVTLEDGGLNDALARMQAAQEKLSEAIRNGASPDEIRKLMDELKAATDDYVKMLADKGDDPAAKFDRSPKDNRQISGDQIQAMMDKIEALMKEGRMAEAQELLDQFNRMMQNLQVTEGGGGSVSRPMQNLRDTLDEQKDLADQSMRKAQDPFGEGAQDQPGKDGSLADRQRALREDLGRQRGLLPEAGTKDGDTAARELDRAGQAMADAERALRDGDHAGAMQRQADAIEALRQGMRALGRAERQAKGDRGDPQSGAQQGDDTDGDAQGGRDPLGRNAQGDGGSITSGDDLPEGRDPAARARELQDEIRRRSGEQARPRDERDYLGRLLDRFQR